MTRPTAIDAARNLVQRDFPDCLAAFMAGSVVRGEATATSDLDIMVIVPDDHPVYRSSFHADGWPIEVFVQTLAAHRYFTEQDAARRVASTSRMVCEGLVLCNRDGWADQLKEQACALLAAGPAPLTERELAFTRYMVSDLIDDLTDARPGEAAFIAWDLATVAATLILDWHHQWHGRGKWLIRSLRRFNPVLADELLTSLHLATNEGETGPLLAFATATLDLVGGRLWEGYRAEAPELPV